MDIVRRKLLLVIIGTSRDNVQELEGRIYLQHSQELLVVQGGLLHQLDPEKGGKIKETQLIKINSLPYFIK